MSGALQIKLIVAMSVHNSVHNTPHNSDDEADPNNQAVTLISKLNLSHPLHLHPNDSTTLIIVSIKLKGTENYNVFHEQALALEGINRIGILKYCRRTYTDEFLENNGTGLMLCYVDSEFYLERDLCFKLIGYPVDCGKRNNISNTNQNTQNFNRIFMNNNNSIGSSSTSGLSDEQISKLLSLIKDNSLNDRGKGVQANMAVNVIDISYLRIRVSHPNGTEALITKNDGSNSSQPSSPTIDQFEGDLGHPQGSNGSANENEMAANSDNEAILSKDDNSNIQTT
ncbi:hypothetical protein Tco_1383230 [Tanacetum coccineum]